MISNYIRYIRLLALCLILCAAGVASASDTINWRSYEEGMVLSKIEKKKVFLHFTPTGVVSAARWPIPRLKTPH